VLFAEFKIFLSLETELTYKGSKRKTFSYLMPINTKFYENAFSSSLDSIIEKYKK